MVDTRRRRFAPQPFDQSVARHGLARAEQQQRQQPALLGSPEGERPSVVHDLDGAEKPELRHQPTLAGSREAMTRFSRGARASVARMKRTHLALAATLVLIGTAAGPARAATFCVDHRPGCFDRLQQAVDAAHDGDTIRIAPGVYRGGVKIDVSVELRGAGAQRTSIHGGGPVLTIGAPFAPDPPTVAISGVTISGGVTTSTELDTRIAHFAFGGGVYIPPSANDSPRTTVTIDRSVIAHNTAEPSVAISPGADAGVPRMPVRRRPRRGHLQRRGPHPHPHDRDQ